MHPSFIIALTTLASVVAAIQCPAGSTPSQSGLSCRPCTGNTFSKGGNGRCLDCKNGYEATPDHTTCQPISCDVGESVQDDHCEPCPPNRFSVGGQFAKCHACPPFQRPNAQQSACEEPVCAAGTALEPNGRCRACVGRHVSPGGSHHTCDPCADFTAPSVNHATCDAPTCPTGQRTNRDGQCVECGPRAVSPGGNSHVCTRCDDGFAPNADKSACVLQASQNAHRLQRRLSEQRRQRERDHIF